ncbi:hypothetical protein L1987_08368 [Smallanthus sonchifolius]|uniref:Uncharacterized protein n=1 Tax=Smallanthus sonchifolius TaxID=185202 RepID=A0ACB9JKW3_9ASTR|nr:hypothetical protein L1987_08368 [Smallanthus sonchifolius]
MAAGGKFLKGNKDDQQFRRKLAWKAYHHVVFYDSAVSEWLWKHTEGGNKSQGWGFQKGWDIIDPSEMAMGSVIDKSKILVLLVMSKELHIAYNSKYLTASRFYYCYCKLMVKKLRWEYYGYRKWMISEGADGSIVVATT